MTYALLLAFFRNDFGFGGNNGLTDFKDILGAQHPGADDARRAVRRLGALRWRSPCSICSAIVNSKLGKVMVAVRDAESRTRFLGWRPENVKLFAFVVSALMAGRGRCALRAAGGHHQPRRVRAGELHRSRDLGRPSADAAPSSGRSSARCWSTPARRSSPTPSPITGCFALGGLFVVVTLFMPKGIVGLFNTMHRQRHARGTARQQAPPPKSAKTPSTLSSKPEPAE